MALLLLLVRASVVIGVAFGVAFALRRRSAAMRADLWRATFVALAVLPLAMVCLPELQWLPRIGGDGAAAGTTSTLQLAGDDQGFAGLPLDGVGAAGETLFDWQAQVGESGPAAGLEVSESPVASEGGWIRAPWFLALFAIWLLGVAVGLTRLGLGLCRAAKIANGARPRLELDVPPHVAVVCSERASGPFVWDPRPFGRPTVVLPETEAGTDPWQRAVLAHELHHIERRDGAFLAFATIVAAILWPTPLARLALTRLRLETEHAADDAVLRAGVRASDYAGGLVSLASGALALPVPGMAARGTVIRRVELLLERGVDRRATGHRARLAAVGGALALCALAGCLAAEQAQEPADSSAAADGPVHGRAVEALVGMHNAGTGAWHGDVGYKLNYEWRVTAADVPHVGITGLAIEALVLADQNPDDTPAGRALSAGIDFLLENQNDDGYFTANGSRMRSHAYATQGLATALRAGIEREVLVPALAEAVQFTIDSQSVADGGWRFTPKEQISDILETAYQHDAARSARRALAFAAAWTAIAALEGVQESDRRAMDYALTTRVMDAEDPQAGAFRFQAPAYSRVTVNTIAAGILLRGAELFDDVERWDRNLEQMREARAQRANWLDGPEGHFLTLDAELLVERVFSALAELAPPEMMEPCNEWRRARNAEFGRHQLGSGAWTCTVGPGDAYITAISCILLTPKN